jgi:hypothetical protein
MLVSKSLLNNCFYIVFILAKSGHHLTDIPSQAGLLVDRLKNEKLCDWNNDWKVITIFVGVSRTRLSFKISNKYF